MEIYIYRLQGGFAAIFGCNKNLKFFMDVFLMKQLSRLLLILCSSLILSNIVCAAEESIQKIPVAFIPNSYYEFQPVLEGNEVSHEFIIKNNGDALLFVEKVKTD